MGGPIIRRGSLLYLKCGRHLRRRGAMKTIDATTGVRHKRQQLTSSCVEHTEDEKKEKCNAEDLLASKGTCQSLPFPCLLHQSRNVYTSWEQNGQKVNNPFLLDFITVITPPPSPPTPSKSVAACQMSGWQTCLLRRLSLSKLKPGFNVTPLWAQTQ